MSRNFIENTIGRKREDDDDVIVLKKKDKEEEESTRTGNEKVYQQEDVRKEQDSRTVRGKRCGVSTETRQG